MERSNTEIFRGFGESKRTESNGNRTGEMSADSLSLLREIRDGITEIVSILSVKEGKKRSSKKPNSPIVYWQEMVRHIDEGWKRKKGSGYPFTPHDFAQLKTIAKLYMAWGVMALWDQFIASDDPFYRQTGYKIGAFVQSLPKLLDTSWKSKAEQYRCKLEPSSENMTSLIVELSNAKRI